MPKYKIVAHRKVYKFLNEVSDQALKKSFKDHIAKLEDYPLSLREMDTEIIRGVKDTFRLRIGGYRIIFFVDKDRRHNLCYRYKSQKESIHKIKNLFYGLRYWSVMPSRSSMPSQSTTPTKQVLRFSKTSKISATTASTGLPVTSNSQTLPACTSTASPRQTSIISACRFSHILLPL